MWRCPHTGRACTYNTNTRRSCFCRRHTHSSPKQNSNAVMGSLGISIPHPRRWPCACSEGLQRSLSPTKLSLTSTVATACCPRPFGAAVDAAHQSTPLPQVGAWARKSQTLGPCAVARSHLLPHFIIARPQRVHAVGVPVHHEVAMRHSLCSKKSEQDICPRPRQSNQLRVSSASSDQSRSSRWYQRQHK